MTRLRLHWLRTRYAPQIAFIRARLAPGQYLGLELTLGALVLIAASWLFGEIAEDVVTGDSLTLVDMQLAQWLHERATPGVTQAVRLVTDLHAPWPIMGAVVLMAAWLAYRRNGYWLLCLSLTVPLGMLLNIAMKHAFQRARPSFEEPLLTLATYSFPSGHVAGSTFFYGVIAAFLMTKIAAWHRRVAVAGIAVAMVALVAFTRMYLGVHYLSDVMAAFALGIAWLALCLTGVHTYWEHRHLRQGAR